MRKMYKLAKDIYYLSVEFEKSGKQVKEGRAGIFAEITQIIEKGVVDEKNKCNKIGSCFSRNL